MNPSTPDPSSSEITSRLSSSLRDAVHKDRVSASELLPLVYDELRRLAGAKLAAMAPGQTLQATALVHEVWLKVADEDRSQWDCRAHFFGAAARAMRNILVDAARRKGSRKHGGELRRLDALDGREPFVEMPDADLLAIDEALRQLENLDEEKARIVSLRFFAGLTMDEVADVLQCSLSHVEKQWRFARSWLQSKLRDHG